ncbi:MAG TPA: helix-turn-helix transcriptional regulator [Thermoanaerobaculia bacterium]|nr:helix-turn-helix transcriptional regulator [Thermoanaerobaculia bacterium]
MKSNLCLARQVGLALRCIRHERGVRQYHVAELARITGPMLSRYESGRTCPTLAVLVKVLQALDCSAEEFGKRLGLLECYA